MLFLKTQAESFKLLNLSDPQLWDDEWCNTENTLNRDIFEYTVGTLIEEEKPDLITISGDIAWAGQFKSYKAFADFIDGFGIPWAPIFGNHDNQGGTEALRLVVDEFKNHKNCLFEDCDEALGIGNYAIALEVAGSAAEGIILMDSHDKAPFTEADGSVASKWAKLIPEQLDWYKERVEELNRLGIKESTLICHIPISAYQEASLKAFKPEVDKKSIALKDSYNGDCWNEGYKESFGVQHEDICCHPNDDGFFELVKALDSTKQIIVGHDHINCTAIKYEGIRLIFSLKTGAGCYWEPALNGGTILEINKNGVFGTYHKAVDVSQFLNK